MTFEDRLRDDPEPVSPEQVMRYWLHEEADENEDDPIDADALETEPALRTELFERNPIAERVSEADDVEAMNEETLRDIPEVEAIPDDIWAEGPRAN